jgi:YegS/Rv2252/BmrU family lipid kinase
MNGENRWVFIINPAAGSGAAASMEAEIREMAGRHNISPEIVYTSKRGDASLLSRKYADDGFKFIIGVGGDGTFNEIASPLVNRREVITGLIPAGTGNDFIQILGFPDRFSEHHWEQFFKTNVTGLDAGSCNGLLFFNGMGLGFDARVAAENYTEPGTVKKGGKSKYIWHILKTILFYRERRMKTISNGQTTESDCFINTVSVGRRFAGGFFLTPEAVADDSLLDVCMVRKLSVPRRLIILTMVPKGTHIRDKRVNYYRTNHLLLEFGEKVPFHLDGELYFSERFDIRVLPLAVNVIYDPSGNHYFGNPAKA